jgi:Bacteroidetes-specific putative membrane protein
MARFKKIVLKVRCTMLKSLGLLLLCNLSVENVLSQQESMYSQYMFNLLHVNPAYAGSRASDNITMLYRHQWVGLPGAPRTSSVSWDRRADKSNIGYGIEIYNDQLGIEKTSGLQLFYSYHIPFENSYLALGVCGGVLSYRANYLESNPYTAGDPIFQTNAQGWLPTAGFGFMYATPDWYVSLSTPALLHTKVDVQNSLSQNGFGANNHYFMTGGYNFQMDVNMKFKPSIMIKAAKGSPLQYDLNANWWLNDVLGLGVSYRTQDALVGLFELQITPLFRIGYAYDYTISDFAKYNKGTHEVMLRLEIPVKQCIHCKEPVD